MRETAIQCLGKLPLTSYQCCAQVSRATDPAPVAKPAVSQSGQGVVCALQILKCEGPIDVVLCKSKKAKRCGLRVRHPTRASFLTERVDVTVS